jgi:hypothetical protein
MLSYHPKLAAELVPLAKKIGGCLDQVRDCQRGLAETAQVKDASPSATPGFGYIVTFRKTARLASCRVGRSKRHHLTLGKRSKSVSKPSRRIRHAGLVAPCDAGLFRCPGEQLTIQVFEDFLRKVWRGKITFRSLNLPNPRQVPIGPTAVIDDNITFARSS